MRAIVCIALLAGGCVRSQATTCGDLICPQDTTCVTYAPTGGTFCAAADPQCLADGTLCDDMRGTCYGGSCFPVGCGNALIDDPVYARHEECDDGNRRSHDGCSSTCTIEVATWTVDAAAPAPAVTEHAMAYDPGRDTILSFGGTSNSALVDTWLRIGSRWQHVRPALSPDSRAGHASAFDAARGEIVVFGGATSAVNSETWLWDGASWTPQLPARAPSPRTGHAMAYDAIRRRVVLYGGFDAFGAKLSDTWTWDGVDWSQLEVSGPPAMGNHAMTFDPVRGEIVMIGETTSVVTWRFDGAQWTLAASGGPPSGSACALAFDPVTRSVLWAKDQGGSTQQWAWDGAAWQARPVARVPDVGSFLRAVTTAAGPFVYGGSVAQMGPVRAAATWNGTAWIAEPVAISPAARNGMGIAMDPRRGTIQIMGDNNAAFKDFWELGAGGWTEIATAPFTAAVAIPVAAYDEQRRVLVAVRGRVTTTWDGTAWTQDAALAPDLVKPRIAYVPGVGVVLVGTPNTMTITATVHMYTRGPSGWEDQGDGPSARTGHALAYDPIAKQLVLFGGEGAGTNLVAFPLNDTWIWDPATRQWSLVAPPSSPPSRSEASLVWNAARGRLILVAGQGLSTSGAWEWDGARKVWEPVVTSGAPPDPGAINELPSYAVSSPDGNGATMAVTVGLGTIATIGMYRLRWMGPGPLEACGSALDLDHDGLAGCADPDCTIPCAIAAATCGNAVCDAGESCVTCAGDCGPCRERCGDFTCSAGETEETCPGDCGMPPAP